MMGNKKNKKGVVYILLFLCFVCIPAVKVRAVAPSDDGKTIALWHMDGTIIIDSETSVPDDDSNNPGRNKYLRLGYPGNALPVLTTGSGGRFGEALQFDGNDTATSRSDMWLSYDSVKVAVWFNSSRNDVTQVIAAVSDCWELYLANDMLTWKVYDSNGDTAAALQQVFTVSQWNHVVVQYDKEGNASLELNGTTVQATGPGMNRRGTDLDVWVGYLYQSGNATRFFTGLIDELKISVPSIERDLSYMNPYEDAWGTYGLWHFDEVLTHDIWVWNYINGWLYNVLYTPVDDSHNPGRRPDRDMNLMLGGTTNFTTGTGGPELVPSFDPNFGNCLYFDGMSEYCRGNYGRWRNLFGLDPHLGKNREIVLYNPNIRVEAWFKLDETSYYDNSSFILFCDYNSMLMRVVDASHGWDLNLYLINPGEIGGPDERPSLTYHIDDITQWHHAAGEFYVNPDDPNDRFMKMYLDGMLVGQKAAAYDSSVPANYRQPNQPFSIGFTGASEYLPWHGWIDEVRISQAVPTTPECGYWGYSAGDINKDCYVNLEDMAKLAEKWLQCTTPNEPGCGHFAI